MKSRRIPTWRSELSGRVTRATSAARAFSPGSAPDDSGAFSLAGTRGPDGSSGLPLGRPGGSATERLAAEASRPCFACIGGLERCVVCKGRGFSDDRDTCDHCLGTGRRNCDFCAGSGLITHEALAPEIRLAVALEQMRSAMSRADTELSHGPRAVAGANPSESLQAGLEALLRVNRLLGLMENGLHLLKMALPKGPGHKGALDRLARLFMRCVTKWQAQMRAIVRQMAQAARREVESSGLSPVQREFALKRATLYASLLRREEMFAGTSFDRPLLNGAMKELSRQGQSGIASDIATEAGSKEPSDGQTV